MIITVTLLASILVASVAVWFFRQRLVQFLPSKETMTTLLLFAPIALLVGMALLPDVLLLISTLKLLPPAFRIVLGLAAATMVCVGCSKHAEPAKPAFIHWKGQDGGYEDTTTAPDKAATQ